ncbi:flavodoxin [Oribacterium sp. C9]|uniref:FprA family A-type flavoprotein n=1 Tax=Oribacterium sp. C9 TaxID=1943579 RepID=UPI00098E9C2B|nr:FprA family A-type flavoprotein [Oribacterium sp. C9]OON87140.1 flavodoxin [Oribacterium sp. C9]
MYNIREVQKDIWWVGASDRRLQLFENAYATPDGMSYNNYLILDDKTCLMDGIDDAVSRQFFDNLTKALDGRELDYMVVQHMEPDHCACIPELLLRYPKLKIVGSQKAIQMIGQFYHIDVDSVVVKEKDTLELGHHTLTFYTAPMVHWPEVIVSFDASTGTLFSADAFGAFGAMSGNIFADEVDWEHDWKDEARRYYANIVGKYGVQTTALLKKLETLDLKMILPLHAHLWRNDLNTIIELYKSWASYTPEKKSVAVFYGSVYGHTGNAADILSMKLAELGVRDVKVYDVSKTEVSYLVSTAFEYSTLVFASATYNAEIFDNMHTFLTDLKNHNLTGRTVGIIENGSWAKFANKKMEEILVSMKNMTILEPKISVTSSVDESALAELDVMAKALAETVK